MADVELTWEIAHLFPAQGEWSEAEYLALPTNQLVEFDNGRIEVLPMPRQSHQYIVLFLYRMLLLFATERQLGEVLVAPLRVKLWDKKFREPDVVFMLAEHDAQRGEQFWDGADLVMEIVSPDDRKRDLQVKREEYARAGIPEYWIVDPEQQQIIVLYLPEAGSDYEEYGIFSTGEEATSVLLQGLGWG